MSSGDRQYFRSMARGGAFALAGKLITYPLGLLLAIVLARLLSPAELGGYFLAMSLVLIASALVQFGVGRVMLKFIAAAVTAGDDGRTRQILIKGAGWLLLTSALAVIALQSAPGEWLLDSLEEGEMLRPSLALIAWLVVSYAVVEFCCEILRGFSDLSSASIFAEQLLQRLLLLLVLVAAWMLSLDLSLGGVMLLIAVSSGVAGLVGAAFVFAKFARLGRERTRSVRFLDILGQAPPFFLLRLNFWLMNTAPVWILGMYHPPEAVALYGVGNLLSLLVIAPWTVANSSFGPAVVRLSAENRPKLLENVLGTVAGLATVAAAGIVAVLVLFGRWILDIVFTDALIPAYATVIILSLGRGLSVAFGAPALLLSMTNHQMQVFWLLLVTSALGLAGFIAAARFGGIEWVAFSGATIVVLQAGMLWLLAKRYVGISTLPNFRVGQWWDIARKLRRPNTDD